MYNNNRDAYREAFATSWLKYLKHLPLEPVEQQLVAIIQTHPEYQLLLEQSATETTNFVLEENPFLHMSLHLSIQEQVRMDLPRGIKKIYQDCLTTFDEAHQVEHRMMEVLGNFMWRAQAEGKLPDENEYLLALSAIVR